MKAVVQILAEPPVSHHLLEIAVRGRNDPNIDLDGLHAAEAHELSLLHYPQQLALSFQGDIADLVKEDGPLVGKVAQPLLGIHGAGERPLHVAE